MKKLGNIYPGLRDVYQYGYINRNCTEDREKDFVGIGKFAGIYNYEIGYISTNHNY